MCVGAPQATIVLDLKLSCSDEQLTGCDSCGIITPINPKLAVMETSMPAKTVSDPGNGVSQGRPAGRKSFRSRDLNVVANHY